LPKKSEILIMLAVGQQRKLNGQDVLRIQ